MKRSFQQILMATIAGTGLAFGQNLCPQFLIEKPMVVNIEGKFINIQHSQASLDVEWHHHPESLDTFFVHLPDRPSYLFITAGSYRYMEYTEPKVKRQLGTHHLKENIGNTPLRLDDMELLANGTFMCKDSSEKNPYIWSTAFSMMWWNLTADTLPQPSLITMKGANKETRYFDIGKWKTYNEVELPTLIKVRSDKYSGDLWIRSAYSIDALKEDPLASQAKNQPKPKTSEEQNLFSKMPSMRERKIPLILQLNKELLRE